MFLLHKFNLFADHPARGFVDGSLTHRHLQPGFSHPSDPLSTLDGDSRSRIWLDGNHHLNVVSHIRVIAAVLADTCLSLSLIFLYRMYRNTKGQSLWYGKLDCFGFFFPKQYPCRSLCRSRSTASGGIAAAQLLLSDINIGFVGRNPLIFFLIFHNDSLPVSFRSIKTHKSFYPIEHMVSTG